MITLLLPTPPSINAAYRNTPRGRAKTAAYRDWIVEADAMLLQQKRAVKDRLTGPCELHIKLPMETKGDISNRIKVCEDYLVSREITGDDKNNHKVTIERDPSVDCCVVTVMPLERWAEMALGNKTTMEAE